MFYVSRNTLSLKITPRHIIRYAAVFVNSIDFRPLTFDLRLSTDELANAVAGGHRSVGG